MVEGTPTTGKPSRARLAEPGLRAVAADHHQRIDVAASPGCAAPCARPAGSANSGQRALPSTVPPGWMMPPTSRARSGSMRVGEQPGVAVAHAEHLPAARQRAARHGAHRGVHAGRVAAAGEDCDLLQDADSSGAAAIHCASQARAALGSGTCQRAAVGPAPTLTECPPSAVDDGEAVLVGDVVAEEYRHAAGERRLAHELLDRDALVAPAGPELEHHLARLHLDRARRARRGRLAHGGLHRRLRAAGARR